MESQYQHIVHRFSDLADRYQQVGQDYYKIQRNYGTGELYTPTEVHLVTRIEENPGITAKRIAEDTCRTKSAVSQMIAKLEDKGLVCREKDPGNGKQHLLYVTAKGKKLSQYHKAYDERHSPVREIIERFGIQALENYIDIVEFLIHSEQKKEK